MGSRRRSRSDRSGCDGGDTEEAKERGEYHAKGVQQAQEDAKDGSGGWGVRDAKGDGARATRRVGMLTRAILRWAERMKGSHEVEGERLRLEA